VQITVGKRASSECCRHLFRHSFSLWRRGAESLGANALLQITYLNSVVMPDEEPSDSGENEDDSDDGNDDGGGEEEDEA
jgi:hypothetical protein